MCDFQHENTRFDVERSDHQANAKFIRGMIDYSFTLIQSLFYQVTRPHFINHFTPCLQIQSACKQVCPVANSAR